MMMACDCIENKFYDSMINYFMIRISRFSLGGVIMGG